ncbi:MAG: TIGR03905 family TSCPD domain-containing protein [Bacteroidales bacterium]|nr:TIGR03905 family TSCPD domain-containing protein [Bacteroidales bacterium]
MNEFDVKVLRDDTTEEGVRIIYAQTCGAVCSQQIAVAVKDGTILEVAFAGGCMGNTQGVASLAKGMKVKDAIARLDGIDCGGRGTSCPDQLTRVLKLFTSSEK